MHVNQPHNRARTGPHGPGKTILVAIRSTVLSIATKIVPAGPVRGILQGGHQVFSTILMYTEKRGRGTILVAIESNEKAVAVLARRRSEILERCGKLFSFH